MTAGQQPEMTAEQRDILVEVGRFHLLLESHRNAARFCREQLEKLCGRLAELEQQAKPALR